MLYWLTESVLADIRNAAMDQGSMWELSGQRNDGEILWHYEVGTTLSRQLYVIRCLQERPDRIH